MKETGNKSETNLDDVIEGLYNTVYTVVGVSYFAGLKPEEIVSTIFNSIENAMHDMKIPLDEETN